MILGSHYQENRNLVSQIHPGIDVQYPVPTPFQIFKLRICSCAPCFHLRGMATTKLEYM